MSFRKGQEEVPKREAPMSRKQADDLLYFLETQEMWRAFQQTIGTAAVQVEARWQARKGVIVKALSTNTGIIYMGHDINVTAASGFELTAGESIMIEVESTEWMFAIADAASQTLCVAAV